MEESQEGKTPEGEQGKLLKDPPAVPDINGFVPDEVKPILQEFPEEQQETVRELIAFSVKRFWKGPLPPPEILRGYNDCFEGGAKAIFDQTVAQQNHRMALENRTLERQMNQSSTGQVFAFVLALALFIVAAGLAYTGHDTVAGIAIGFDVVGLAAVFIAGKDRIRLNIGRKRNENAVAKRQKSEEDE